MKMLQIRCATREVTIADVTSHLAPWEAACTKVKTLMTCFVGNSNLPLTKKQILEEVIKRGTPMSKSSVSVMISTWNNDAVSRNPPPYHPAPCTDWGCRQQNPLHRVCCKKSPASGTRELMFWINWDIFVSNTPVGGRARPQQSPPQVPQPPLQSLPQVPQAPEQQTSGSFLDSLGCNVPPQLQLPQLLLQAKQMEQRIQQLQQDAVVLSTLLGQAQAAQDFSCVDFIGALPNPTFEQSLTTFNGDKLLEELLGQL